MTLSSGFNLKHALEKTGRAPCCLSFVKEVEMAFLKGHRSKNVQHTLFAGLLTIGLAAGTAIPALAGTATFNKTGSMNTARMGHSATLLANGQVLVAGGWNGSDINPTFFASAELYDPVRGKWS